MAYDYSAENIEDSGYSTGLTLPYCGKVRFTGFEASEASGKAEGTLLINFNFEVTEEGSYGVKVGEKAVITEWPPKDEEDKIKNALGRIGYLCAHLLSENKRGKSRAAGQEMAKEIVKFQGETIEEAWANLAERLKGLFEKATAQISARDDFSIKMVGDTYGGKPRVGHPKYNNFISDRYSASPLTFSADEMKKNGKYIAAVSGAQASSPTGNGGGVMAPPPISESDDLPDF